MIPFLSFRGHANLLLWGGLAINYIGLLIAFLGAALAWVACDNGNPQQLEAAFLFFGIGGTMFLVGLALAAMGVIMPIAHRIHMSCRNPVPSRRIPPLSRHPRRSAMPRFTPRRAFSFSETSLKVMVTL